MLARTFARDASHGITRARVHKSAHTTRPRSETVYARTWFVSVIGSPSAPKANHPHHASAHPTLARLSPKATTSFFSQSKFTWPLVARATVRFFILTFEVQFFFSLPLPHPPFSVPLSFLFVSFSCITQTRAFQVLHCAPFSAASNLTDAMCIGQPAMHSILISLSFLQICNL